MFCYLEVRVNFHSDFLFRHATMEKILERLTDLRFLSIDFLNTFLLTYRVYTDSMTVLNALIDLYESSPRQSFDHDNEIRYHQDSWSNFEILAWIKRRILLQNSKKSMNKRKKSFVTKSLLSLKILLRFILLPGKSTPFLETWVWFHTKFHIPPKKVWSWLLTTFQRRKAEV